MLSVTTRKHKLWTIYLANNTPFNCYCSLINIWWCFVKITIAPLKYPKRVFRRNYANKLQLSRHDVGLKIEAILKSIGNKKRKSQKHALDMRSDNKSSSAVCCPLNVWVLVRHTIKVYQKIKAENIFLHPWKICYTFAPVVNSSFSSSSSLFQSISYAIGWRMSAKIYLLVLTRRRWSNKSYI